MGFLCCVVGKGKGGAHAIITNIILNLIIYTRVGANVINKVNIVISLVAARLYTGMMLHWEEAF